MAAGWAQARLLVDKQHMGIIMGRGGATVAELRKSTGANIKILANDAGCAHPACERVHIFGEPCAVRAALEAVSSKLRTAQASTAVSAPARAAADPAGPTTAGHPATLCPGQLPDQACVRCPSPGGSLHLE